MSAYIEVDCGKKMPQFSDPVQIHSLTESRADDWLRTKGCQEADFLQWVNCEPEGVVWRVVSLPGHFNASWLSLAEFDASLKHHGLTLDDLPAEYLIIRMSMSLLAKHHGSRRVRLVVWFS